MKKKIITIGGGTQNIGDGCSEGQGLGSIDEAWEEISQDGWDG